MGGFRTPEVCLTFAGQSLNGGATIGLANSYPHVLIASLRAQGIRATRYDVWVGGAAWVQLDDQPGRFAASQAAVTTILCMVGGTTDYAEGGTALATVAAMETIATEARAAGFNYVINTTTTPAVSITAGAKETERVAGNLDLTTSALYPTGAFDRVVDFCAEATLDAYTDSGYVDETHFSIAGAILAASLMETAVLSLI